MKTAIIDYETYYDSEISVVTLGLPNYVANADAYIVGITIGEEVWCGTLKEMAPVCDQIAADAAVQPVAANSNFDQAWWEKYHSPFKKEWHCVLDQGAFNQYPRNLAMLAGTVLGVKVDKEIRDEMKGKRYEDQTPEKQQQIQEYCANDCVQENNVLITMPPMTAFEERVAAHTRMINRRGVHIDMDLVRADKTRLEEMRFHAFRNIPWYRDEKPLSPKALATYCNSKGLPVPTSRAKNDEECTELMSEHPELKEIINIMRRYGKANTMLKKCAALDLRVTGDNILSLDIIYCGAPHTRRWSSKGFNVQNLDKEPLKTGVVKDGIEEAVWTRNWLVPAPGCIFYILDFAQIEPRCLNWLIDNKEMMEALRAGFSYYEAYACAAKGWKNPAGTLKAEFGPERYTKLKNECLGCGYGMGPDKYMSYAFVAMEEAKRIVSDFRRTNPKVVKFWHRLDALIASSCRDKERHLMVEMPSGEPLQYFHVRTCKTGYEAYTVKGDFGGLSKQPRLWGGTLTENVCQRMGRDILANAVLNLEAAGIPVIFHSHDEVILQIPVIGKEKYAEEARRIMVIPPEWAPDLPLGVDGDYATAYTKLH